MRMRNNLMLFGLLVSAQLLAGNGKPIGGGTPTETDKNSISFSEIFYSDYENTTLFVDFQSLGNQFSELNILRDRDLMMHDDIRDLPTNTIYEINLAILREGTYILELKTPDGIKVHKEFVIN